MGTNCFGIEWKKCSKSEKKDYHANIGYWNVLCVSESNSKDLRRLHKCCQHLL